MMNRSKVSGVTLIELMIVVTIVSILAAIAYPTYTQYVQKSKRSVAKSLLTQVANRQEQYFLDNKMYADDLTKLSPSYTDPLYVDKNSNLTTAANAIYEISITAHTNHSFTLSAVPKSEQTSDATCMTFTLANTGEKGISGSGGVNDCW